MNTLLSWRLTSIYSVGWGIDKHTHVAHTKHHQIAPSIYNARASSLCPSIDMCRCRDFPITPNILYERNSVKLCVSIKYETTPTPPITLNNERRLNYIYHQHTSVGSDARVHTFDVFNYGAT